MVADFGLGFELGPQDRPAELVLTERLRPLAEPDVAPDRQPMCILATRIVGQEVERPLQGRPVVALGEMRVGQGGLDREIAHPESFPLEHAPDIAADAQVPAIERGRSTVREPGRLAIARPMLSIAVIGRRLEGRDIEPDPGPEVQPVQGGRSDHEAVAVQGVTELAMQAGHQGVERVPGKGRIGRRPDGVHQLVTGDPVWTRQGQDGQEQFSLAPGSELDGGTMFEQVERAEKPDEDRPCAAGFGRRLLTGTEG